MKASAEKTTQFDALKTYAWDAGRALSLAPIDDQIVTAVDRELARAGLVKVNSQPSDVLVTYAALQRTDVDLKSKLPENPKLRRQYPVGSLVVLLREPGTLRELFRGRADAPLASDPAGIAQQIDAMIAQMFERYPTRRAAGDR